MSEERGPAPHRVATGRPDGRAAAGARMARQHTWVDLQVRRAMARGDFDDLPGAGKPLDLGDSHDPNWWLKKLVERENVSILPPSLALRREDAELEDRLDALGTEDAVRREVADFNARVIAARYRTPEGPPLVTMPREVEATLASWRERRTARIATQRRLAREALADESSQRAALRAPKPARRRWWRR